MVNKIKEQLLVSIIIPAHNEEKTVGLVIQSLLSQNYQSKEIIVVNDNSTDNTKNIIEKFKEVKQIINEKNIGLAKSINTGLKIAKGEFAIVLHSDCVPENSYWLEDMLAPFNDEEVGAVVSQREIENYNNLGLAEKLFNSVVGQELLNTSGQLMKIDFFRDKADAYRLNLIKDLGYFDETITIAAGEDTDLSFKMRNKAYKILLSNKAKIKYVFSSHQRSLKSIYKKALQYGQAQAVLYERYKYDGLKSRLYLFCFFNFFLLPISFLSENIAGFLSFLSLMLSFNFKVNIPGYNKKFYFGLFLLLLITTFFIVNFLNTRTIQTQIVPLSITAAGYFFYFYSALKVSFQSLKKRKNIFLFPLYFINALIWYILLGIGYFIGYFKTKKSLLWN